MKREEKKCGIQIVNILENNNYPSINEFSREHHIRGNCLLAEDLGEEEGVAWNSTREHGHILANET